MVDTTNYDLLIKYQPWIRRFTYKHISKWPGISRHSSDILSEVNLRLLKIVSRYDPNLGDFKAFCYRPLVGAIQDYFRKTDYLTRNQRNEVKLGKQKYESVDINSEVFESIFYEKICFFDNHGEPVNIFVVYSDNLSSESLDILYSLFYKNTEYKQLRKKYNYKAAYFSKKLRNLLDYLRFLVENSGLSNSTMLTDSSFRKTHAEIRHCRFC